VVEVVVAVVPAVLIGFPDAPDACPNVPAGFALAFPSWCSPYASIAASEQQLQDLS
jgi:hypothetical protein